MLFGASQMYGKIVETGQFQDDSREIIYNILYYN